MLFIALPTSILLAPEHILDSFPDSLRDLLKPLPSLHILEHSQCQLGQDARVLLHEGVQIHGQDGAGTGILRGRIRRLNLVAQGQSSQLMFKRSRNRILAGVTQCWGCFLINRLQYWLAKAKTLNLEIIMRTYLEFPQFPALLLWDHPPGGVVPAGLRPGLHLPVHLPLLRLRPLRRLHQLKVLEIGLRAGPIVLAVIAEQLVGSARLRARHVHSVVVDPVRELSDHVVEDVSEEEKKNCLF